ncbi:hypothetical protein [Streptomyces sp. NBC_00878]|uniref:hypothetical protein n=1 Tax=Streptomyces sp. NBC_00878 TaxID=2975854 RepID=UPI002258E1D2|nr:hypothetical protein [Streptomyces sp. NBC_00878]MCX4907636.1 hypothetical protein [Streptomyces sp. NBC_00878]
MRGRELPYPDGFGQEDAAQYMQECYADEGVDRSREPAVLVRASTPEGREVFHGSEQCGLIVGGGRQLQEASWILLGDAKAVGYRLCARCGTPDQK